MKKSIIVCGAILATLHISNASARCIGSVINGKCYGSEVSGSDDSSSYTGSSGLKYQYDLNNPADRSRYSTDLNAQRRDQMSIEPSRTMDRGLGQLGDRKAHV